MDNPEFIDVGGRSIAFRHIAGRGTGVFYIGGHTSKMDESAKNLRMRAFCAENSIPFTTFDFSGYGHSPGAPERWQIEKWGGEVLAVMDQVIREPVVLAGNSMGGYLMLLAAMARPEKTAGLIGMAAGFGSYLQMHETHEKRIAIPGEKGNLLIRLEHAPFAHHAIAEPFKLSAPLHLFHGKEDDVVHWHASARTAEMARAPTVQTTYVDGGNHGLAREEDLRLIFSCVKDLSSAQPPARGARTSPKP